MTTPPIPPGFVLMDSPPPPPGFVPMDVTAWKPKRRGLAEIRAEGAAVRPAPNSVQQVGNTYAGLANEGYQSLLGLAQSVVQGGPVGQAAAVARQALESRGYIPPIPQGMDFSGDASAALGNYADANRHAFDRSPAFGGGVMGDSGAAQVGNFVGGQLLPIALTRGMPTGVGASGKVRAAANALQGLTYAQAGEARAGDRGGQRLTEGGMTALVSAPLGPIGDAFASGARYLTDAGRNAIADARIAKLLGHDPATINALRQPNVVPGVTLDPAQALQTTKAVQTVNRLRANGNMSQAFSAADAANNVSLRSAVSKVAGTDADMTAAVESRRTGSGAFWKNNLAMGAENARYSAAADHLKKFLGSRNLPMPEFNILDQARRIAGQVQRGSVGQAEGDAAIRALQPKTNAGKKALGRAIGFIDQGMVNPNRFISSLQLLAKQSGNKTVKDTAQYMIDHIGNNQDGMGWVHARVLDDMVQNIGKNLQHHAPQNTFVGSQEAAEFGKFRSRLIQAIDRTIGGYRQNRAAYAAASQPINDMHAAKKLLEAIDLNNRDALGNQHVTPEQVKALIHRDNHADFPMSDSARAQIGNVLEAMQRRSVSKNNIPGISAEAANSIQSSPLIMRAITQVASIAGGIGGYHFGPGGSIAGYAAGHALAEGGKAISSDIATKMGVKAATAQGAADSIEAYLSRRANRGAPNALARLTGGVATPSMAARAALLAALNHHDKKSRAQ